MPIYQHIRRIAGPLLRAAVRLEATGLENVPRSGPVMLVSNHLSIVDSTFLPLVLDRHVTFMAKAEYFRGRGLMGKFISSFMNGSGQISVDRADQRAAVASLDPCLAVLEQGGVFCIYPEGTRSPDGRLYRARTGVAWLALKSQAPVVPVAMCGTDRVLPPGRHVPRPARVRIIFGPPVDLTEYAGRAGEARARRLAADTVTDAVAALSGQEYVPVYATSAAT
ncbi:lysophospholipid acyltransferase family protein [Streptomyces sp. CB03238]|uniref:lysophospholipid acyltransferase family protein n=1 Tax=Streptomyces sp. CB03238 TaxID=1907777 RepID=UPI000D1AA64D|nr:lysophospholipid acyltransferase family protein [Streptomyces sp. CB03238]